MSAATLDKLRERANAAVAELMMVAMRWETKRIWAAPTSASLYSCLGMTSEATAFQKPSITGIELTRL